MVVGLAIRVSGLSEYWLNPDEGIYYSTLTRAAFGDFWTEVMENAHPPGFYLLLRAAGYLTWDFVWLRGISAAFGALAIWALWLVGREIGGKGKVGVVTGLVAAGLLAVNGEAIALSQILRPYMPLLALLALALVYLLRYRSEPTAGNLAGYVIYICLALLTHYSAALAFASFTVVVAWYRLNGTVSGNAWRRVALVQAAPALILVLLYVQHLGAALGSDLMRDALDAGGWLSAGLVSSPSHAWDAFVGFQIFHLPPTFQGRSALIFVVAIAVSALSRDRTVAVLAGTALFAAVLASVLGLYPLGPSRHSTWLVLFTLPPLGWLVARAVERGVRTTTLSTIVVAGVLLLGGPAERVLRVRPDDRSIAFEERLIRRADIAGLVVGQLDTQGEPRVILMTEQSYNVMMPMYSMAREEMSLGADSTVFGFSYGDRDVVVVRQWDWRDLDDVKRVVEALPRTLPAIARSVPDTFLLVAGGWGSRVFPEVIELMQRGEVVDWSVALGRDQDGQRVFRVGAFVVESRTLTGDR